MPTYEYSCYTCNEIVSITKSIHEQVEIPFHCGQFMSRIYTGLPVKFNSDGFYSTGG